jgi:hypothetical protein
MEELCIGQRPAPPCGVWAKRFVDFGLQLVRRCVARHQLGGIVGRCPPSLVSDVPAQFYWQVYNGHSNFIDNIVLTSHFSNFGMPVDSLSTDTTVAVSSWYFYNS